MFSSFGVDLPEADLRALCDCTIFGTDAPKAVEAARQLGFTNTIKTNLSLDELKTAAAGQQYPIVFVNLRPIAGHKGTHALVVLDVSDQYLTVFDPDQGELQLPRNAFSIAWEMQRNLAILIEP